MSTDIKQLAEITSRVMDIPVSEIFKDKDLLPNKKLPRKGEIVVARQTIMYNAINELHFSQERAGKIFKQDHATALNGKRKVSNLIETNDPLYASRIRRINSEFKLYVENKKIVQEQISNNTDIIEITTVDYVGNKNTVVIKDKNVLNLIKNIIVDNVFIGNFAENK